MKHFAACLALFLFSACSDQKPTIGDFAGDWETATMTEVFDEGLAEQLEDILDGTHPGMEEFDDPEWQEILSLPKEEARKKLAETGVFQSGLRWPVEADLRIGFTISPPSRLIAYMSIDGERRTVEYDAEFEVTAKEIICRYEDGPTVLTFSGDDLLVRNEREGYPRLLRMSRATSGPKLNADDGSATTVKSKAKSKAD